MWQRAESFLGSTIATIDRLRVERCVGAREWYVLPINRKENQDDGTDRLNSEVVDPIAGKTS